MIPLGSKLKKQQSSKKASSEDDDDDDDAEDEVDDDSEEVESIANSDENNNNDELDELTLNKLTFDKIKVKLCDFSFSQVMNGTTILGMMGTVAYSAPEVLEFDALTKATDMW
jgi:serine/threonine protein kinase